MATAPIIGDEGALSGEELALAEAKKSLAEAYYSAKMSGDVQLASAILNLAVDSDSADEFRAERKYASLSMVFRPVV